MTVLGHAEALCLVVLKHMKQALCFLHWFSLYCAACFLAVQCVVLCVFCSQNMQYLGHDGPSAGEPPVKPRFRFDWPYPVSHRVAWLSGYPKHIVTIPFFVAGRPECFTMRYNLVSIIS